MTWQRGIGYTNTELSNMIDALDASSGGGAAAVWGTITGTLSSQTDLNSVLTQQASDVTDVSTRVNANETKFAGGFTGTFPIVDGSTVTVTDGLITGITP